MKKKILVTALSLALSFNSIASDCEELNCKIIKNILPFLTISQFFAHKNSKITKDYKRINENNIQYFLLDATKMNQGQMSLSSTATSFLSSVPTSLMIFNNNKSTQKYIVQNYIFNNQTKDFYKNKLPDYEFNSVVTFGDSLSDSGTFGRSVVYMANGDIKALYNTILSEYYSGKPNQPYTTEIKIQEGNRIKNYNRFKGVNYAVTGALVAKKDGTKSSRRNTVDLIDLYLKDFDGKADPNSIYIYWAGGNDLASQLVTKVPIEFFKTLFVGDKKFYYDKKIYEQDANNIDILKKATKGIGKLLDAGAGYVYFLNLPGSGYAPFTQMLLEGGSLGSVDLVLERYPLAVLTPTYWLSKIADDYLRNPALHIGNPRGRGKDYIIENNVAALKHRYFFLPTSLLSYYYNFAADIQNVFIRQFNNEAKRQLASIGYKGNIIYVDVDALFTELMDNYQDFGIDEVLVPQCQLGLQSTSCDFGDARFHNDKIYAFTDWHHPSAYSHLIIAQYMQSILDAPVYAGSMFKTSRNLINSNSNIVDNILKNWDFSNNYNVIANYSITNNKSLNTYVKSKSTTNNILNAGVGFNYNNTAYGAILTFSYSDIKAHDEFEFNNNSQILTLFLNKKLTDKDLLSVDINYARLNFNDIKRHIFLAKNVRTETSATSGDAKAINLNYEHTIDTNYMLIKPNLTLSLSDIKIKGFEEDNNLSTSMKFGKVSNVDKKIGAGVSFEQDIKKFNYKIGLKANYKLNNKNVYMNNVSIKSAYNTSFKRNILTNKKSLSNYELNINPTVNYKTKNNYNFNISVDYNTDIKNNSNLSYSLRFFKNF